MAAGGRANPRFRTGVSSSARESSPAASSTAASQRASHSAGTPPYAPEQVSATSRVGHRSPAAACESVVAE
ncbi:hypothetical protein [Streptomyces griseorubiginosus]|uniref:hypothetical protein n=1 Tax=Streptomyces griseorubiginosus TaxID=67304 RepID=UPI0015E82C9C|nr:hypothetical protein [Streptomyces griseorubiginosus]